MNLQFIQLYCVDFSITLLIKMLTNENNRYTGNGCKSHLLRTTAATTKVIVKQATQVCNR